MVIHDKELIPEGAKRIVCKFAWWPIRVKDTYDVWCTIWLEAYTVEEYFRHYYPHQLPDREVHYPEDEMYRSGRWVSLILTRKVV